MGAEVAKQKILAHRQVRHDRLAPAVLGDKANACANRVRWSAGRERPPLEPNIAAVARAQAEQRLHRLGPPRADQAAKPQDLAAMKVEGHVAHERRGAQTAHGQNRFRALFHARDGSRVDRPDVTANHQPNELGLLQGRRRSRGRDRAALRA